MPRFSANISTLFRERPLLERFAAARRAGFAAVEIQFPYEAPLAELVRAKEAAGVAVDLINLPAGDFSTGVRGIAGLPEPRYRDEFRAGVAKGRDYAKALGARKTNVLAGIKPVQARREDCLAQLAENARYAAEALAAAGVRVVVEAINHHDVAGFLVNRTEQALAVAEAAGPDVGVQADLYHMARMGEDIPAALQRLGGRLAHVQFADAPGRGEPGSGALDWATLFSAVDHAGYAGFAAAEYNPTRRTEETLGWLDRAVRTHAH